MIIDCTVRESKVAQKHTMYKLNRDQALFNVYKQQAYTQLVNTTCTAEVVSDCVHHLTWTHQVISLMHLTWTAFTHCTYDTIALLASHT